MFRLIINFFTVCRKCHKRKFSNFEELITIYEHCTCKGGICDKYNVLLYLSPLEKKYLADEPYHKALSQIVTGVISGLK